MWALLSSFQVHSSIPFFACNGPVGLIPLPIIPCHLQPFPSFLFLVAACRAVFLAISRLSSPKRATSYGFVAFRVAA
jgi:hypothetical protein